MYWNESLSYFTSSIKDLVIIWPLATLNSKDLVKAYLDKWISQAVRFYQCYMHLVGFSMMCLPCGKRWKAIFKMSSILFIYLFQTGMKPYIRTIQISHSWDTPRVIHSTKPLCNVDIFSIWLNVEVSLSMQGLSVVQMMCLLQLIQKSLNVFKNLQLM